MTGLEVALGVILIVASVAYILENRHEARRQRRWDRICRWVADPDAD